MRHTFNTRWTSCSRVDKNGVKTSRDGPSLPVPSWRSNMRNIRSVLHDAQPLSILKDELNTVVDRQCRKTIGDAAGLAFNVRRSKEGIAIGDNETCKRIADVCCSIHCDCSPKTYSSDGRPLRHLDAREHGSLRRRWRRLRGRREGTRGQ